MHNIQRISNMSAFPHFRSRSSLRFFAERLPYSGMDDVQNTAETLEGVQFGLLLGSQSTRWSFRGEFFHAGAVTVGEPQLEESAGSKWGKFPFELNHSLPDCGPAVGSMRFGSHGNDYILEKRRYGQVVLDGGFLDAHDV